MTLKPRSPAVSQVVAAEQIAARVAGTNTSADRGDPSTTLADALRHLADALTPAPLSYNIDEASAALGSSFTPDWLKARIRTKAIPFGKTGDGDGRAGRIFFTQRHLERILAMYSHEPDRAALDPDLQPVTRRRRAS